MIPESHADSSSIETRFSLFLGTNLKSRAFRRLTGFTHRWLHSSSYSLSIPWSAKPLMFLMMIYEYCPQNKQNNGFCSRLHCRGVVQAMRWAAPPTDMGALGSDSQPGSL